MTKVALGTKAGFHVDDIVISGRFLYEAADSTGVGRAGVTPFHGARCLISGPTAPLKSECVIEDGEWGFQTVRNGT